MKRMGFVILAVVIALGAMGAGYAAWSQNLVFTGTVASGTFDTTLVNVTAVPDTHGATLTVSGAGPAQAITVTAANLYPGVSQTVTFKVNNPGTIPATVDGVVYSGVPTWVDITDDVSNVITGSLDAGATSSMCTLTITMPDTTVNEGIAAVTFTFTVPTTQTYY